MKQGCDATEWKYSLFSDTAPLVHYAPAHWGLLPEKNPLSNREL
jgi:hypothetical protein